MLTMLSKNYYLTFLLILLCCTLQLVQLKPNPEPERNDAAYDDTPMDEASDEGEYDSDYEPESDGVSHTNEETTRILSVSKRISALEGDNVNFDCEIDKRALFVVQWFKGKQLIYQDDLFALSRDLKNHYHKFENGTLSIMNVSYADHGEYICQVKADKDLSVKHHLSVKIPPKIVRILPNDNYQATLSERLDMICEASGSPVPKVNWVKKGERVQQHSKRNTSIITFEKIKLTDAGTYQCMADNQVGDPAVTQIRIRVAHKPQIQIEKSIISSEKDYTSVLTCIARANPTAITEWFKDGNRILPNAKYNISDQDDYHILQIKNTEKSDFGKYTCESTNHLGTTKKEVLLTPTPVPIKFEVQPAHGRSLFKWSFQSLAPVLMYDLQLQYPNSDSYIGIFEDDCNPTKPPIGNIYSVECYINTPADGEYETKVNARNTHGNSIYKIIKFKVEPVPENISTGSAAHMQVISILNIFSIIVIRLFSHI